MKRRALSALTLASLVALAVFALAPLLWMVSVSLMPAGEATASPPRLLPSAPTLAHYEALFSRLPLARAFANSLLLASAATVLGLLSNSLAGYAFAKLRFRGRDALSRALLAALVIPGQVAMLPLFLLVKELGLVNTYAGVLVPSLASIFGIFLVRQYVLGIPDALLDAARLDGAGELRVFTSVVLPLCRPVLVTLGAFTFLGAWNDFLWPLVVLGDEQLQPLPVALASLLGEHAPDVEILMAGSVLTVLPVVVLFVALQRHYLQRHPGREPARVRARARRRARAVRRDRARRGHERAHRCTRRARPRPAPMRGAGAASRSTGRWSARPDGEHEALLSEDGAFEPREGRLLARALPVGGRQAHRGARRRAEPEPRGGRRSRSRRWSGSTRAPGSACAPSRRTTPRRFVSYRVENPRAERERASSCGSRCGRSRCCRRWQFLNLSAGFAPIREIARGRERG